VKSIGKEDIKNKIKFSNPLQAPQNI